MVTARAGYLLKKSKLEFSVTGLGGGGRVDGGHRDHCIAQRVGPRVMGTATYRF